MMAGDDDLNKTNGKGNGHDPHHDHENHNVVPLPSLKERDRIRREEEKRFQKEYRRRQAAAIGPVINLPPLTKYLIATLVLIHLGFSLLDPSTRFWVTVHFGFVPGAYTGEIPFGISAIAGPFTYMLLHGGWLHVVMNAVMLAAFGAGVERWLGSRTMLIFMIACGLIAAAVHFVVQPTSTIPVVGASGAVSGMFAAAIVMLMKGGMLPVGRFGILPIVLLWIGISVLFGLMGGPGGESIAWAAHIGGFLGGFAVLKLMRRL